MDIHDVITRSNKTCSSVSLPLRYVKMMDEALAGEGVSRSLEPSESPRVATITNSIVQK